MSKTLYYQALEYLIEKEKALLPSEPLIISFKYADLKFSPPFEIGNTRIIYLYDPIKQQNEFRKNGILKIFEIEPIDVNKNLLELKINVMLSVNTNQANYVSMLENLSSIEKESLLNIIGKELKDISISMNIETHLFNFLYDCDRQDFRLSKHLKEFSLP